MTYEDFVTAQQKRLTNMPNSFWAKKFTENHIPNRNAQNVGGGVYCGKFGALLGNNYATSERELCEDCLKKKFKEENPS